MMRPLALLCLLAATAGSPGARAAEAGAAEMYAQAVQVEREVEALKRHFKMAGKAEYEAATGNLGPRHIRAQAYVLMFKLGKLRRKHGLTYIQPGGSEPSLDTRTSLPWGTVQRILTEIRIVKYYLDIPGQAAAPAPVPGKRTVDVYNKLHQIAAELDQLTGPITPSEVYAEAKRLNEDVNAVQRHLRIVERAMPPARREDLQAKDSLGAAFEVLAEIQRIQRDWGQDTVDFAGFDVGARATPDDVFGLLQLALAEWQRYKALIGMTHYVTPPAGYEEAKTPADVVQLLGYVADKLRDIETK